MGFLDNVSDSINRGTEAAARSTWSAQLRKRSNELVKNRQKLAAQLGAALYEKLKNDPGAHKGFEQLFDGMAAIDAQRGEIQKELMALEAEAAASAAAAATYRCPNCGMTIRADDLFCSGCGKPADEVRAQVQPAMAHAAEMDNRTTGAGRGVPAKSAGPACPKCGAPVVAGDRFCMSCGAEIASQRASRSSAS